MFQSLGEYIKAKEYIEKALVISIEIGHREGEATWYVNFAVSFKNNKQTAVINIPRQRML